MKDLDTLYDSPVSQNSIPQRVLVFLGKYIVGTGVRLIFRARYEGLDVLDKIPQDRPVIIAGNHSSYTDPLFVFDSLWPRRIRFMAKAKLFEHKLLDYILAWYGVFPVHADIRGRKAIKRSIAMLKNGEYVGIFPEGTRVKKRDKTDVKLNDGVALIAKMADALIVPVGLQGTIDISPNGSKLLRFPKVIIRYGEPVDWRDWSDLKKGELLEAVTAEAMRRVYLLAEGKEVVIEQGGADEVGGSNGSDGLSSSEENANCNPDSVFEGANN